MLYRPEINGLRSFAVLPVIFFHAGFSLFSGGYIGVDVFFVISGFLITTIIVEEMRVGRFSIMNFYERRARRILPALFFVMLVSLPFAWALLSPADLHDFAQSLVAIAMFGSNFLFWQESGYFDTAAELKPMLHTWSLAVEEQYYVLFPLLILVAWRFGTKRLVALIAVIAAASLLISEVQVRTQPSTAFFLLPSRAWQLLVGSMAAFLVVYSTGYARFIENNRLVTEGLGGIGLIMILWATFWFDDRLPFPGLTALVPTIGTALVLLFSSSRTLVGRLLAFRPLVGIGLISYSAYLWHQPIFAFTRHAVPDDVPVLLMLGLSLLTLGLAYLSWRFIENPFRSRGVIGRQGIFALSAAGMLAFIGMGIVGHVGRDSMTDIRLRAVDSELRSTFRDTEELRSERERLIRAFSESAETPFSNAPETKKVLILGDSVSNDLYAAMMANLDRFEGMEVRRMRLDDRCMGDLARLLARGEPGSMRDRTCFSNRNSIELLRDAPLFSQADVLVLNAYWPSLAGHRPHLGVMALAETLAAQGRQVLIVGLVAMKDASSLAYRAMTKGLTLEQANAYAYSTLKRSHIDRPNAEMRALAERVENIGYLDKYAVFCNEEGRSCELYDDDTTQLLFADTNHVSGTGAAHFGRRIADLGWFK
jgi:peptidoglycan/LPS O-acetylase OafA/YrhL